MGKRGPQPQPIAILEAKGTRNVTRTKDAIVDAMQLDFVHNTLVAPPDDLPEDAAHLWTEQLSKAQKLFGYISFIDLAEFKQYCITYSLMNKLYKVISKKPLNKCLSEWNQYHKVTARFDKLSAKFGFNPSARLSITLEQPKNVNKVDEYGL